MKLPKKYKENFDVSSEFQYQLPFPYYGHSHRRTRRGEGRGGLQLPQSVFSCANSTEK